MKHPTSRLLHAYWDRLRGERAAPERAEIEPGAIRNLLADSLILEIDPTERRADVRLAGTRVCALFARELKGASFAALWGGPGIESDPWRLVETVASDTVGLIASLRGATERGETVDLELLLLPLRHRGRTQARMLGALSPHLVPDWLGLRPLASLETVSVRILGTHLARIEDAPQPAHMPPPANDFEPVRRGHLMVHTGGRT